MGQLVRLRPRRSRDGKTFTYMLDYVDTEAKDTVFLSDTPTGKRPNGKGHRKSVN
jgi:hypothetical protein